LTYRLWKADWRLLARVLSHLARFLSGVEIHPAATIGRGFFVDHGAGVVIGETSKIGESVTIYHGVTLGGIAPAVDSSSQVNQKRHPTLGDGVIVGSGAQVLGPITVGANARVGANAVVLRDVPEGATVVGNPARIARARRGSQSKFEAYGAGDGEVSDPVARIIDGLLDQLETMKAQVADLESQQKEQYQRGSLPWRGDENKSLDKGSAKKE
jgi:serine O-acetyltransferase